MIIALLPKLIGNGYQDCQRGAWGVEIYGESTLSAVT